MSDLDEFKATYFDECSELLLDLEEQFIAIQDGDKSSDRMNAIFRAIHSIKGGAGAFGFSALVGFAHEFETLLDFVRNDKIEFGNDVIKLCIRSNDLVADFVEAARDGNELEEDYGATEKAQFVALCKASSGDSDEDENGEPMEEFDIEFTPVLVDLEEPNIGDVSEAVGSGWLVEFIPFRELYLSANDPLLLLRELAELGEIDIKAIVKDIPHLGEFEPFSVYCTWEIIIKDDSVLEEKISEIFEFVEGDCELKISKFSASISEPTTIKEVSEEELEDEDMPSFADLAAEIAPKAEPKKTTAKIKTPNPANSSTKAPAPALQSIRVDLEKVDRVVNMVGELVITQSMLTQQMDDNLRHRYQELVRGLEVLATTTRGLQDSVMAIRAQPVKSVFSRMPRLVRELAGKTGKKIKLDMVGENTEIDKTVIEQLSDPLTHMIRNSADHGIESVEKRIEAGKPETGTIRLSAEQAGGSILIIIEDDGAGINRERVLQLAREKNVVGEEQQLSDDQIDNLIFAPGFSTVEEVSDLSGRGVGMDVVLSNINKIGGSVIVKSVPGRGTRMTLRLPLTLAVLDVMLVRVAGCPYVLPLSSIVETMQCARVEFGQLPTGTKVLQVRGEYVQSVDLASHFDMQTDVEDKDRFVVLCEAEGTNKLAIIVDAIIGQQQVVIKSLEENFERIDGIAGGTILGDGSVGLIVDVQGIKNSLSNHQTAAA
ncbi:Signal transduction histidine kinase CheA [hydrothermal vent metagenome]|uniref:Chemotaxis protein CheA n=1 Tax=hydrothermal vent metagenome TaxID=652676 RepID=A0A3B0VQD1_9ZZZZ